MSDTLVSRLEKLKDARLAVLQGPTEEITLLEMAIDALKEKADGPGPQPGESGCPLTREGLFTWVRVQAQEQDYRGVLVELLASYFAQDYATWDQNDLLQLVCEWDRNGFRGWNAYTLDELFDSAMEEINSLLTDANGDSLPIDCIEKAVVAMGWIIKEEEEEDDYLFGEPGMTIAGLPVEDDQEID